MAVRDVVQAAAGQGGDKLYVEDVFSTYLYTGNGSTQTITNGIDLAGEGGLVWTKGRATGYSHSLIDTVRGIKSDLRSNDTDSALSLASNAGFSSFNSTGYSIAGENGGWGSINISGETHASWTFRKAPKFFDVVTYTGNGVAGKTVAHNLGSVPGCIIIKAIDSAKNWEVYHRSVGNTAALFLNLTNAINTTSTHWNNTSPTENEFTLGTASNLNGSGINYVAYLFAHDAGGFGDDGEQNVISCGGGTVSSFPISVELGWEPQWFLFKRSSVTEYSDWLIFDAMRGMSLGLDAWLKPNSSDAEVATLNIIEPNSTGFKVNAGTVINTGESYIYIAIRRGPMKTPESGTEVFHADANRAGTRPSVATTTGVGFAPDLHLCQSYGGTPATYTDRLRGAGAILRSNATLAESVDATSWVRSLNMDGITIGGDTGAALLNYSGFTYSDFYFKRAPGFFDVVGYTGTGVAKTEAHNLGVVPEMMIVRMRSLGFQWMVYHKDLPVTGHLFFSNQGIQTDNAWNDTAPTDSVFSIKTYAGVNRSADTYVNYLFASLPGVSKVGSYTGTGANLNVDCGFSAGARFVLIKRTDSSGDWYYWDSARGIAVGNDPYLLLNTTGGNITSTDYIDPLASGFTVTSSAPAALNANGGSYIFLAIA